MKGFRLKSLELTGKASIAVVCFLTGAMHAIFLLFFINYRVTPLAYFNIGSVVFYMIFAVHTVFTKELKHYLLDVLLIFTEIVIHAVLCTLLVGVDTFFVLYPIIALPICGYFLFFNLSNRRTFLTAVIVMVGITFIVTGVSVAVAEFFGGYIPTNVAVLSRKEKMMLRVLNITFAALVLFSFTTLFYVEMNRMMKRLRESAEQLRYTATHDALTGLTNRRSFWEYFDALCNDDKHYNIAMGDLDNFKRINDTYGHGCGDMVLKSVSGIILEMTAENEIACRWGGEEMVVVFMGDRDEALRRLEEIRNKIQSLALQYSGLDIHVTMTFGFADSGEIGLAVSETHTEKKEETEEAKKRFAVESLISMVDKRLYVGKTGGKNMVVDK